MTNQISEILKNPVIFARALGYDLIGATPKTAKLHNKWIKKFIYSDLYTLQAHRESYKTSCLAVAITLVILAMPEKSILLLRKTDSAISDIAKSIEKNLKSDIAVKICKSLWGVPPVFTVLRGHEISLNIGERAGRKESQFLGLSISSRALTGKHFHKIYTDDIITHDDRYSKAEREKTQRTFLELNNLLMPQGSLINTGTPWHKQDCFKLMKNLEQYDVYSTGIMSKEQIEKKKLDFDIAPDLWACNYELRHVPSSKSMFGFPNMGEFKIGGRAIAHIDCAYSGEDRTAFTIFENNQIFGKVWSGHWQDKILEIMKFVRKFQVGYVYMESNADKGYGKNELLKYHKFVIGYHESTNKHIKIVDQLGGGVYKSLIFDKNCDESYLQEIQDYYENCGTDDCPDSLASILRVANKGKISAGVFKK